MHMYMHMYFQHTPSRASHLNLYTQTYDESPIHTYERCVFTSRNMVKSMELYSSAMSTFAMHAIRDERPSFGSFSSL